MIADPTAAAYRGRFAPSPTGDLHLGSAATAIVAWLRARASGGVFVLRVEDTDLPRIVAGSEARQLADLRWLGLDWDEGPDVGGPFVPYRQSERGARYEAALRDLDTRGLLYLCDCSRREIAGIASAPHPGEEGPRYPGTCRKFGTRSRPWKRPPALRVALPDRDIRIRDAFQGEIRQNVWREIGDFVVKRGDGVYAYQLAVVVDDLAMRITEVVRGADLLASAPRQALLAEMLGVRAPDFAHVPLVVDAAGTRLEKRNPAQTLHGQREMGRTPRSVVARLLTALGLENNLEPDGRSLQGIARTVHFSPLYGRRELRLPT